MPLNWDKVDRTTLSDVRKTCYASPMEVTPLTRDDQYSANIRAEVTRLGRRQTEVATESGLSWPQWQRRISGPVSWRAEELEAIARTLGVPLENLLRRPS